MDERACNDLLDRLDIIDVCTRNHWYVDHKTWDDLDSVLADTVSLPTIEEVEADPDFDPENYLGRYARTREQIKRGYPALMAGLSTQHVIAGHQVELRGDRAVCRAHSINIHFAHGTTGGSLLGHGNEYRFDLIRTTAGWRICGRVTRIIWSAGDPSGHDVTAKQRAWLGELEAEETRG